MSIRHPFTSGPSAQTPLSSGDQTDGNAARLDILIAENNEINKCYLENVLSELGYNFYTVENGLAVVEAYMKVQPRLVLMDIAMPLSDGVEATVNIRRHEKRNDLQAVPIIALSANAIPGLRERYLSAGMNDSLLKPYSIEQIQQKLEQWILPLSCDTAMPQARSNANSAAGT